MVSVITNGYNIEAMSFNDVVVEVAGVMFPVKRLAYAKTIEVKQEWGTGSRLVYDLTSHNIGITGSFDVGTWITQEDRHALTRLLEDQADEGKPKFFNIQIMERLASGDAGTVSSGDIGRAVFEKLIRCKLTKSGRDYPENATVMTQYEFIASERWPL